MEEGRKPSPADGNVPLATHRQEHHHALVAALADRVEMQALQVASALELSRGLSAGSRKGPKGAGRVGVHNSRRPVTEKRVT